jgi:hypothetical protein
MLEYVAAESLATLAVIGVIYFVAMGELILLAVSVSAALVGLVLYLRLDVMNSECLFDNDEDSLC